jgi:hypothetical protein
VRQVPGQQPLGKSKLVRKAVLAARWGDPAMSGPFRRFHPNLNRQAADHLMIRHTSSMSVCAGEGKETGHHAILLRGLRAVSRDVVYI